MIKAVLKRYLRVVLAAATLSVSGLGTAQAAIYTGVWDPAFGPPFTTPGQLLGWKGSASFSVPDACLALSGNVLNSNACSLGAMSVLSAQVVLYDFDDISETPLDTLVFDPLSFTINSVNIALGEVTDIESDLSDPEIPSSTFAGVNTFNFELQFELIGVTLSAFQIDGAEGSSTTDITLTRVPEPGSLALVGGALLALGLARRRRA